MRSKISGIDLYCATTKNAKSGMRQLPKTRFSALSTEKYFFYINNVNGKVVQLPKTYKINMEVFFLRLNASTLAGIFQGVLKNCNFFTSYL